MSATVLEPHFKELSTENALSPKILSKLCMKVKHSEKTTWNVIFIICHSIKISILVRAYIISLAFKFHNVMSIMLQQ